MKEFKEVIIIILTPTEKILIDKYKDLGANELVKLVMSWRRRVAKDKKIKEHFNVYSLRYTSSYNHWVNTVVPVSIEADEIEKLKKYSDM